MLRRWLIRRNSRAYELNCARDAYWTWAEMDVRHKAGNALTDADRRALEGRIITWARANQFNRSMGYWSTWHLVHGPAYPVDMTWADPFVDDIDQWSY